MLHASIIRILVELVLLGAVASPTLLININHSISSPIDHYRQVMYVIVVAKKVCSLSVALL